MHAVHKVALAVPWLAADLGLNLWHLFVVPAAMARRMRQVDTNSLVRPAGVSFRKKQAFEALAGLAAFVFVPGGEP